MRDWKFNGDVNLEYGGTFIDLDTFADGYCDAVVVTDLDSACGFTGAMLIEHVVINGTTDAKRISEAVRSCGNPDDPGLGILYAYLDAQSEDDPAGDSFE